MKQISCEESEKYDREELTVGSAFSPMFPWDNERMTEWGTKGDTYIPVVRDYVFYELDENGESTCKIIKCEHYVMEEGE